VRGSLLTAIAELFDRHGVDLARWAFAFARVMPIVVIVPAFGLRALSAPVRAAIALLFGALLLPAVRPMAGPLVPWPAELVFEVARGTLVAITAAIPLWSATMAGGIVDVLRGAQDQTDIPTVENRTSPMGALFSLLAATIFLASGGPAHVVGLLIAPPDVTSGVARAAANLARGIGIATAIAAPLIGASLVVEVAGALVARAASPAHLSALIAPIRSLALLALSAILLDRLAAYIAVLPG
jgi:type III secretory pathway component EscT